MSEHSEQDWHERVDALLQAVRDVQPRQDHAFGLAISARHRALFDQYVADLKRAIQGANNWWSAMLDIELDRANGDLRSASREVARRNPVGPVADRGVIAVLRSYWLACDALNAELSIEQRVAPEDFALGRLVSAGFEAEARFLSQLPYWPLGMTTEGEWI